MIVCPECSNLGNKGYVFCPDDGSRLMELDDTILEPGTRVNVNRVGRGTVIAASGDDYLDPDVLCYAIVLDHELSGETRHWFLKKTGVDVVTDWSLIEEQPLPPKIPLQKRYFAAHCEVFPITEDGQQVQSRPTHKNEGEKEPYRPCPACGKRYDATASYCSVDGTMLTGATIVGRPDHRTMRFEDGRLTIGSQDEGAPLRAPVIKSRFRKVAPAGTGKTPSKKEVSPFHDLLTEIDKKNRAHWIKTFNGFVEGKYNLAWNWPSFIFGPFRYFVKGMWAKGIGYGLFAAFFQAFLVSAIGGGVFFMAWLATTAFFALMGSNDYYKFCLCYKEDLKGAKRETALGVALLFLTPFLLPILISLLNTLF